MWIPKEWPLFLGSLLIVAALYNHYLGQWAYFAELVLIAIGIVLALYSLIIIRKETKKPENGILVDLLSRIMTKEQSAVLVPLAGFLLIAIWSGWKLFVTGRTDLRMEDFIVTLFGASLVLHDVGPSKYAMEKDFVVLYLMFLTIVFAVIWKTYTTVSGDSYYRINAYSGYYFMTIPVVFLVRLFGVGVSYELDASSHGISNTIIYEYHGENLSLGIGEECSGLYSAGLFFTALLAFVLVRYRRVDRYILAALGLGFVLTWLSNILRMVLTILVGSIWGHPALVFVHDYIGILIFVAFVTVFWLLIVRWLDKVESRREPSAKIQAVSKPQEA